MDFVNSALLIDVTRNGLTGEILHSHSHSSSPLPLRYRSRRVRRTRLQAALLSRLPGGIIQLNKRLVSLRDIGDDGAELGFGDGTVTRADLVVGGDGIRSVSFLLPLHDHHLLLSSLIRLFFFPNEMDAHSHDR